MKYMMQILETAADFAAREAGEPSSYRAAWRTYYHALLDAGVYVDGAPLKAIATATTVRVRDGRQLVQDGPFAETKELVAGYWMWEVKDMDEAVEWVKRCPNPMPGPSEIEIRPVYVLADFGEAVTPEAAAIHEGCQAKLEER